MPRRLGELIATRHRLVPLVPFTPEPEHTELVADVAAIETASIAADASLDTRVDVLESEVTASVSALGALTGAADKVPYFTSASVMALATLTAYARTIIACANAAAAQAVLGIGAIGLLTTVTEADMTLADNVTNNVGITKHGFAPKAPNDATKFLNGVGAYAVPAGVGPTAYTLPVTAGFSWVNQGTASLVDSAGIYSSLIIPSVGSRSVKARVKSTPATPYTITALLLHSAPVAASFPDAGLCWRESSSGKLVRFVLTMQGGVQPVVFLAKENSPTSFNSSYTLSFAEAYNMVAGLAVISVPFWMRLTDDGTNRKCWFSADGDHWFLVHSVGRTDFITPDQIGFCGQPDSTAMTLRVINWVEA